MPAALAIDYNPADFDAAGPRPMGRRSASEGLLRAIARYGSAAELFCLTGERAAFDDFCRRVGESAGAERRLTWVPAVVDESLAPAGTLLRSDPMVASHAWQRRSSRQRSFSLCGLTHNVSTPRAMEALGAISLAPLQEWDAIVCPSEAVKGVVEHVLADWHEYLAARLRATPAPPVRLPVIPLGVDCDDLEPAEGVRGAARAELGIPEDDVAFLFVGRLVFYSKAHPVPMYLAIERAAREHPGKTVHLVHAGWFEDQQGELATRRAAETFAPSVRHRFVDGQQPRVVAAARAAADVFVSLADNIQETFGLTPIEAMAAGLPGVVSDWDGYGESVREGEDGFRVPTYLPPAGAGQGLAGEQLAGRLGYWEYLAATSAAAVVDVGAAAEACSRLIADRELRAAMGAAARARARERFDWRRIVPEYERLWDELAAARADAEESAPLVGGPAHPLYPDPFRTFAHYSTATLSEAVELRLAPDGRALLARVEADPLASYGAALRLPGSAVEEMLDRVEAEGQVPIGHLLEPHGDAPAVRARVYATVAHLMKLGVLERNS